MKRMIIALSLLLAVSRAEALPSKYDLRELGRVTPVKNQGIPGPCWAFAALGAMESNYLTKYGTTLDLSELHLAYYLYKDKTASKSFTPTKKSGTLSLEGNATKAAGFLMRLSGPVSEKDLPYTTQISDALRKTLSTREPESYKLSIRLRDVYFLAGDKTLNDSAKKELIMNHGAIVVSLYSDVQKYHSINKHYTYYNSSHGTKTNHDLLVIGWDDDFSRDNFSPKPKNNGAWLAKNSWGTSRGIEGGYVWISYEQFLRGGTAFITEKANRRMKCYSYDDLGVCSLINYSWGANIFRIKDRKETLTEASFYTPDNNMRYDLYVYSLGTNPPMYPISGELVSRVSGFIEYAGYHTIDIPDEVTLASGEYFSVVVKLSGKSFPIETRRNNYSMNAVVHERESWFSHDGKTWTDGKMLSGNACIKAYTLTKK